MQKAVNERPERIVERHFETVPSSSTEKAKTPDLPEESTVPSLGTPLGHQSPRPKTAAEKVRCHLEQNPDDISLSVRDLADKLGVGKSTVSRVKKEFGQL